MKILPILILALLTTPVAAEVYKCKSPSGGTIYQAEPCPGGARLGIQVRAAPRPALADDAPRVASAAPRAPAAAPLSQADRERALADQWAAERRATERAREIERDLVEVEGHIQSLRNQMDAELAGLRAQQRDAANNLAGAAWLQAISQEMQAVTARYQGDIQSQQARLATLRAEQKR